MNLAEIHVCTSYGGKTFKTIKQYVDYRIVNIEIDMLTSIVLCVTDYPVKVHGFIKEVLNAELKLNISLI